MVVNIASLPSTPMLLWAAGPLTGTRRGATAGGAAAPAGACPGFPGLGGVCAGLAGACAKLPDAHTTTLIKQKIPRITSRIVFFISRRNLRSEIPEPIYKSQPIPVNIPTAFLEPDSLATAFAINSLPRHRSAIVGVKLASTSNACVSNSHL
jgi:hypothetical protein